MDKMSMEELGFFLYMEEMERQQKEEQEAQKASNDTDEPQRIEQAIESHARLI